MREIEVKAKLPNKDLITEKLKSMGCSFKGPFVQHDVGYAKVVGSLSAYLTNTFFARIRTQDDNKVFFTIKQDKSNRLDKIEHEVSISSSEEMEKMLRILGLNVAFVVHKTRLISHYKSYEICIDEVQGLGPFIEVEKLIEASDQDGGVIQNELFSFLMSLGVKPEDRVTRGYDLLILGSQTN